jgi:hypothetical protein
MPGTDVARMLFRMLFGLLRVAMFLNAEKWQQDVDAFDRIVRGVDNESESEPGTRL